MLPSPDPLAPFLAAIRDDPDDDVPRLQLADWLDEQGDPKGEFIRVQIELTRLAAKDPRRAALARREQDLLRQHGAVWLPQPPSSVHAAWERGMTAVVVGAGLAAAKARGWWLGQRRWVTRLRLTDLAEPFRRCLAAADLLADVPELDLSGQTISEEWLVFLARLTALRGLDLGGTRLPGERLIELAELTRLRTLGLWGAAMDRAGTACLTAFPLLRTLNLNATEVTDVDLEVIAGLQHLESLSLNGTPVGDAGLRALSALPRLRALYLYHTRITDKGLDALREMGQLESLSLGCTAVTDAGVRQLTVLPRLQVLSLNNTAVTDAAVGVLRTLPLLRWLYLRATAVTDTGVVELERALPYCLVLR